MSALEQAIEAIRKIPSDRVAILTVFVTVVGGFVLNHIILPLGKTAFRKISGWIYPYLSGFFVLDRIWSLPRYVRAAEKEVAVLSNPWLSSAQKLDDIYVPVHSTGGESPHSQNKLETRPELNGLFATRPHLVLVGPPGSGKTTGLKSIALNCIRGVHRPGFASSRLSRTPPLLPVFLRLRRLAEAETSLTDFVEQHFAERGFPHGRRLIEKLEREGRLVFLLDGLDEVEQTQRYKIVGLVNDLFRAQQQQKRACPIVVTSRPNVYSEEFSDFAGRSVEVADFDAADIKKFVANFTFRPPKTRGRLLAAIQQRPPLQQICRNPLMLTIVTSLYAETDYSLPDSREEFYRRCIEALLQKWDDHKNIEHRNRIRFDRKEAFLQELAYNAIQGARFDWRDDEVFADIEAFLKQRSYDNVEPERFRFELLSSGLIIRLPTGENQFAHKTLAESLAAAYMRSRSETLQQHWSASSSSWLEVVSLYVADSRTPEKEIEQLLETARARGDINSFLILAGEAHTVPDHLKRIIPDILETFQPRWNELEDRAVIGLCELGQFARASIELMLKDPNAIVRARTLRALGVSSGSWTSTVLANELQDPNNARFARSALIGMGETALPVLRELLLRPTSEHPALFNQVLSMLQEIGGFPALETCFAVFSGQDKDSFPRAALACATLLADPGTREAFEGKITDFAIPAALYPPKSFVHWAAAWIPAERLTTRELYAFLISMLCQESLLSNCEPTDLAKIAPRILLPVILHSYYKFRTWPHGEMPPTTKLWRVISGNDKSDLLRGELAELAPEATDRPAATLIEKRPLWGDVHFPSESDIKVPTLAVWRTVAFCGLVAAGFILLRYMASISPSNSAHTRAFWEIPIETYFYYISRFILPVAWMLMVVGWFWGITHEGETDFYVCLWGALFLTVLVANAVVGGYDWIFILAPSLLFLFQRGKVLVLYRRSNPLTRLCETLERRRPQIA
jgi:hypothetical protein